MKLYTTFSFAFPSQETGARLVFSNRNDYFPETKYRVGEPSLEFRPLAPLVYFWDLPLNPLRTVEPLAKDQISAKPRSDTAAAVFMTNFYGTL